MDRQASGEHAHRDPFPQEETAQSPGHAESEVEGSERGKGINELMLIHIKNSVMLKLGVSFFVEEQWHL